MSAHTTLYITAADARKRLMLKLLEASDEALESMMDAAFYVTLYNFRVVAEYDPEETDTNYMGQV